MSLKTEVIASNLSGKTEKTLLNMIDKMDGNKILYKAKLTQTGVLDPVSSELINHLGVDVVWTRLGIGSYIGTLSESILTDEKSDINISVSPLEDYNDVNFAYYLSANTVKVETTSSGVALDGLLSNTTVSIEVYP